MRTEFTKMHGIGNDFVLIDATRDAPSLGPEVVRRLSDRRRGVGFDQLLVAEPPARPDAHIAMRVYNADGTTAGQCGNGLRCFARFARDAGLAEADEFVVEVAGDTALVRLKQDSEVLVRLTAPRLDPADVPLRAPERAARYPLDVAGERFWVGAASLGNPHVVVPVERVEDAPIERVGPAVQAHEALPESANVGFVQVVDRTRIRLRVYERGAGETEACGSGACAAVVVGRVQGALDETVNVELPGGTLVVSWRAEGEPVWMSGPTARSYRGVMDL